MVCRSPGDELCATCRSPACTESRCRSASAGGADGVAGSPAASARGGGWRSRRRRAAIVYDDAARALVRSWKERGLRGLRQWPPSSLPESWRIPTPWRSVRCRRIPTARSTRGEHRHGARPRVEPPLDLPVVAPIARSRRDRARRASRSPLAAATSVARSRRQGKLHHASASSTTSIRAGRRWNAAASRAAQGRGARRVHVVSLARAVR